jgi:hypothetical protein
MDWMKVKGLDGREYSFPPQGHVPDKDETRPRSEPHLNARAWIKSLYPTMRLLEEVRIPGAQLYLDFYLPQKKMAFEVQGRQHYEFVPHFHEDVHAFQRSKRRDQTKRDWCAAHNIRLFELPDSTDEWYERLLA